MKIYHYPQADSTNTIARTLIEQGDAEHGTLIHADVQTGGRGQYDRTFCSPSGGLYFSLILFPRLDPTLVSLMTLATGVACSKLIELKLGQRPKLKWPNDVYYNEKKLAGILCESIAPTVSNDRLAVIIGVGININSSIQDFPDELSDQVTSLFDISKEKESLSLCRDELVTLIMETTLILETNISLVLDQWQQCDYLRGKRVSHTTGSCRFIGTGCGIDESGCYIVRDEKGNEVRVLGGQLRLAGNTEL